MSTIRSSNPRIIGVERCVNHPALAALSGHRCQFPTNCDFKAQGKAGCSNVECPYISKSARQLVNETCPPL